MTWYYISHARTTVSTTLRLALNGMFFLIQVIMALDANRILTSALVDPAKMVASAMITSATSSATARVDSRAPHA